MVKITAKQNTFGGISYKLADPNNTPLKKITKPLSLAFQYLHSVDGIDDIASGLGQTLPGLAAPTATATLLIPPTPFVIAGAAGAIHESIEQFRSDYPAALQKVLDRQTLLIANFKRIGIKNNALKRLLSSHIQTKKSLTACDVQQHAQQFLQQAKYLASHNDSQTIWHHVAQCEEEEAQRHISRIERDGNALNAAAMTGMSMGMLTSTTAAVTNIAQETGTALASTVPSILGTTTNAVFLPSQILMAMSGVSRFKVGKLREKALQNDQQAIDCLHHTSPQSLNDKTTISLNALIERKRQLNKYQSTYSGALLASGQTIMAGNSIAALSGAGIAATAALAPPGIALTLAGVGLHIAYEKKEEKLTGANASAQAKEAVQHRNQYLDTLVTQDDLMQAIKNTEKNYADYQAALAHIKLFSLMKEEIKTSEKKDDLNRPLFSRTQRQQRMHAMVEHGKKGLGYGTSLLHDDLLMTQDFLKKEKAFFAHPTQENQRFATARLANAIEHHPFIRQHKIKESVAQKIELSVVKKLIKQAKHDVAIASFFNSQAEKKTGLSDLENFAKRNETANDIYQNSLVKHLVHQGKMDAKFLRHDAAQHLIQLAHLAKESQQSRSYLNPVSFYVNQRTTLPHSSAQPPTQIPHIKLEPNISNMQMTGYKNLSFHLDA